MGMRAAGAGTALGNAAAQSIIAKSKEFSIKHEDGGSPAPHNSSVNISVPRSYTLNPKYFKHPIARSESIIGPKSKTHRQAEDEADKSFQLWVPREWRHTDGHRGRGCTQRG